MHNRRVKRTGTTEDPKLKKYVCKDCGESDPKMFYQDRGKGICKKCYSVRGKQWRDDNRDNKALQDRMRLLAKYGLTQEIYDDIMAKQGNACAICFGKDSGGIRSSHLVVDHDHSCCPDEGSCGNCVRGLLCHSCNRGIGQFSDDPDSLESAARYLRRG